MGCFFHVFLPEHYLYLNNILLCIVKMYKSNQFHYLGHNETIKSVFDSILPH